MERIDIDSTIFEQMKLQFNKGLRSVLCEMKNKDFEEGNIKLNLNIRLIEEVNEDGEIYHTVGFDHEIKTDLKKSSKMTGSFRNEQMSLFETADEFYLQLIPQSQTSVFDEENSNVDE